MSVAGGSSDTLLYGGGFVITDVAPSRFAEEQAALVVARWPAHQLGGCTLRIHRGLRAATCRVDRHTVFLLGTAVDPVDELHAGEQIARRLAEYDRRSTEEFLDYLDQLTGRFVIVCAAGDHIRVYQDACGLKPVFYDSAGEAPVVASHASLVAAVRGYTAGGFARRLRASPEYQRSIRHFPGLRTPYDKVRLLTANTYLDLSRRKVVRFYPREPLRARALRDGLVDELVSLLERTVRVFARADPLLVSLTAGIDSRMTLAATRSCRADVLYFTHVANGRADHAEDARVAAEICRAVGLRHRVVRVPADYGNDPELLAYRRVWRINTAGVKGDDRCWISRAYMASLPRRLHLKSAIGGLGKAFYQKRFRRSELSPAYLAWLYAIEPADPQVIGSFEEFIHVTDFDRSSFRGYDFRDMFYWEHRMSAWESLSMLGYEAAHETVSPYGNRRVCELLLSAPLKDRLHHRVHTLAIERMWPELLEFTIGPATRRTLEACAWQMLPYHTQRALRPLALRLLRTRDVRSGSPAGSCRPSLPRGSSDWGA